MKSIFKFTVAPSPSSRNAFFSPIKKGGCIQKEHPSPAKKRSVDATLEEIEKLQVFMLASLGSDVIREDLFRLTGVKEAEDGTLTYLTEEELKALPIDDEETRERLRYAGCQKLVNGMAGMNLEKMEELPDSALFYRKKDLVEMLFNMQPEDYEDFVGMLEEVGEVNEKMLPMKKALALESRQLGGLVTTETVHQYFKAVFSS